MCFFHVLIFSIISFLGDEIVVTTGGDDDRDSFEDFISRIPDFGGGFEFPGFR